MGHIFSRRSFVIGALQFLLLGGMAARLIWLQVFQGDKYRTLSDKNRINTKLLIPSRGIIYDRDGKYLAKNEQNFRVFIVPEQTKDLESALFALDQIIGLEQSRIERVLSEAKKKAQFVPLEVKDNLSWEDVAKIEVNLPDLPGLSIDTGEIRTYPYGQLTAHIIGHVGAVNKSELTGDRVLTLPGFKIGKTALEKTYDLNLRGRAGNSHVEVNVTGREIRELSKQNSKAGSPLVLSVDIELQEILQKRLAREKSASAVIMDAKTGAIYALASSPSFDPNMFTKGVSVEDWEALLADSGYPLTNKAVAGQYPPGSTFKMVTALAALETGIIDRRTRVTCPGYFEFGGDRFHCWKHSGHGSMDLVSALSESCDTYFYKISTELGIEKISAMARILGLGNKLDIELREERPGLMPDKNWKMGYFGESWKTGETIVASIGQSYIQTTPLQLAVMTARLINGGFAVKPWIVSQMGNHYEAQEKWPELGFKKEHLDLIKKGMDKAVNHRDGTAFKSRIENASIAMGGKTGTAQVRRITMAQRLAGFDIMELPWKHRHHALFVGYGPVDNPRYVCSVVVEHGGGGSISAAPLAKDIMVAAQKKAPHERPIKLPKSEVA